MKVILLQNVPGTGIKNQVVNVADGYAINFLIKKNKAVLATEGNLAHLAIQQQEQHKKYQSQHHQALHYRKVLNNKKLLFTASFFHGKASTHITIKKILQAIKETYEVSLDKPEFINFKPIRKLGSHQVQIKLFHDVVCLLTIILVPPAEK